MEYVSDATPLASSVMLLVAAGLVYTFDAPLLAGRCHRRLLLAPVP